MQNLKRQPRARRAEGPAESSEFGADVVPTALQALHLVARGFGLNIDLIRLMRDNQVSGVVVSAAELMRCATSAGLRATGLSPGWRGLKGLSKALPAIVMLRDGDALLLLRVDSGSAGQIVVVQDPRCGEQTLLSLDCRQFASIWSGEIILLQQAHSIAEATSRSGLVKSQR